MIKQRNHSIDLVKFFCAIGVVMIHMSPSTPWAGLMSSAFSTFAVPYFLIISLYFTYVKLSRGGDQVWKSLRLERIVLPYITWTLIYIFMRLVKYRITGGSFSPNYLHALFFGGSGVQMYYLPLLLFIQVSIVAGYVIIRSRVFAQVSIAILVLTLAIVFGLYGSMSGAFGFKNALLNGFIYILFSYFLYKVSVVSFWGKVNLWLSLVLFPGLVWCSTSEVVFYPLGYGDIIVPPLIGYTLCVLSINAKVSFSSPVVLSCLGASFGIYLAHFGFLEIVEFLLPKFGLHLNSYSLVMKLLLSALIICMCIGLIRVARKQRWLALWILGEHSQVV